MGDVPDGGDASALAPGAPNVSSPLANLGDVDCQVDVVEKYSCEVECPTSVDHPVSVKGLQVGVTLAEEDGSKEALACSVFPDRRPKYTRIL